MMVVQELVVSVVRRLSRGVILTLAHIPIPVDTPLTRTGWLRKRLKKERRLQALLGDE
jgi:hypothetical protein